MKHESAQPNTSGDLCRRNFLQLLSLGTVGLGFGVSIFTRGYAMAEEEDKEMAHRLLMQGTKDFKGVMISEITPNCSGPECKTPGPGIITIMDPHYLELSGGLDPHYTFLDPHYGILDPL